MRWTQDRVLASADSRAGSHPCELRGAWSQARVRRKTPLGWPGWGEGQSSRSVAKPGCEPSWLSPSEARKLTCWDQESVAEINFHGVRSILSVSWSLWFSLCGHFGARSQRAPGGISSPWGPCLFSNGNLHGGKVPYSWRGLE